MNEPRQPRPLSDATRRRIALMRKKYAAGLDAAEAAELDRLLREAAASRGEVLDEQAARLAELKARGRRRTEPPNGHY